MRVKFYGSIALAFNDYGQVAKIEGSLFRLLIKTIAYRQQKCKKREETIAREIVAEWSNGWLDWVDVNNANK
jgi:hypothetical protein